MSTDDLTAARRDNGGSSQAALGRGLRSRTFYQPLQPPPAPRLVPEMRADEALQLLGRHQLGKLLAAQSGVVLDLHPEHVHDFRVAVRRTRSLLGQLRSVLLADVQRHFDLEFRWLADETGRTRDLDVLLEALEGYAPWVSADLRGGLPDISRHLITLRRDAHAHLVDVLESDRYRMLVREWQAFLAAPLPYVPLTEDAGRSVADVAHGRIGHKVRRIFGRRGRIDADVAAADLHRLRIEFKKLRYLVEFFRDLYPAELVDEVIAELKRIQDGLGSINDRRVHHAMLMELARSPGELAGSPRALVGMGEVMRALTERLVDDRRRFAEDFHVFTRKKIRRRYERLG